MVTINSYNELTQIQIGANVTQGHGTGGSLELGRKAAAENMDNLQSIVSETDMIIIIAGMGGGTGTAVAPVIASLAQAQKTLTVCIATRPFDTEDRQKKEIANQGLSELQENPNSSADAVIVVPNQQILDSQKLNLQISELFQHNSDILRQGVNIILDILAETGEISVGYDDLQSILRNQGTMLFGLGKAKGENRATIAAKNALNSLLLQENTTGSDSDVTVSIYSPPDFTMKELDNAMVAIIAKYQDSQPIFGLVYKDELEESGEVIVSIISSCIEKPAASTPSTPTRDKDKLPKEDHETPLSTDPDSIQSPKQNVFSVMFGQEEIPETVQTAIDNSVSAAIIQQ